MYNSNSTNLQQITMNELTQTKDDFLENVLLLFWIREIMISIDENEQRIRWTSANETMTAWFMLKFRISFSNAICCDFIIKMY